MSFKIYVCDSGLSRLSVKHLLYVYGVQVKKGPGIVRLACILMFFTCNEHEKEMTAFHFVSGLNHYTCVCAYVTAL